MRVVRTGISRDRAMLSEFRRASAAGGSDISTRKVIALPSGFVYGQMRPHTLAGGATVAKWSACPYLAVLKTIDNLATTPTDASEAVQAGLATAQLALGALSTFANGDYLLMAASRRYRGVIVDVVAGQVNAVVSVLTAEYWNGSAWVDLSATDGTASGGATFAQDGDITWTMPTAWKKASAQDILVAGGLPRADTVPTEVRMEPLFWTRWKVSVALSATVNVASLFAMSESANDAEARDGQDVELWGAKGVGGLSAVVAVLDAGTGKLIVNVASPMGGFD